MKPLIYSTKNPDQSIPAADRGLINRFTEAGIDALVEYYNAKYPDRGVIHRASAWAVSDIGVKESHEASAQRINQEFSESATPSIAALREKQSLPIKIMLTVFYPANKDSDRSSEVGYHSIPILLTEDKLIVLRDEASVYHNFLEKVAENLGVELVRQILRHESVERFSPTSMQADVENCNGIAVGILKDLTSDDLEKVVKFEKGYTPLAKMLKYSQSAKHILQNFPQLMNEVVKDGERPTTLADYVIKNGIQIESSTATPSKKVATKITTKMNAMKDEMLSMDSGEVNKGESWGKQILKHRQEQKAKSESRGGEVA